MCSVSVIYKSATHRTKTMKRLFTRALYPKYRAKLVKTFDMCKFFRFFLIIFHDIGRLVHRLSITALLYERACLISAFCLSNRITVRRGG